MHLSVEEDVREKRIKTEVKKLLRGWESSRAASLKQPNSESSSETDLKEEEEEEESDKEEPGQTQGVASSEVMEIIVVRGRGGAAVRGHM